jgi:hypothetical protein
MGYTHYWTQPDLTADQMLDIGRQVKTIIKKAATMTAPYADYSAWPKVEDRTLQITICGGDGTGKPQITLDDITLNGQGPDMDHETFFISRGGHREFCKTARKPYDVVVVACLTFLAADYGFEVSSDGDVEDWEAGVELAEKALGRPFANPLIVEQLVR